MQQNISFMTKTTLYANPSVLYPHSHPIGVNNAHGPHLSQQQSRLQYTIFGKPIFGKTPPNESELNTCQAIFDFPKT